MTSGILIGLYLSGVATTFFYLASGCHYNYLRGKMGFSSYNVSFDLHVLFTLLFLWWLILPVVFSLFCFYFVKHTVVSVSEEFNK